MTATTQSKLHLLTLLLVLGASTLVLSDSLRISTPTSAERAADMNQFTLHNLAGLVGRPLQAVQIELGLRETIPVLHRLRPGSPRYGTKSYAHPRLPELIWEIDWRRQKSESVIIAVRLLRIQHPPAKPNTPHLLEVSSLN